MAVLLTFKRIAMEENSVSSSHQSPDTGEFVTVFLNSVAASVHRGSTTVLQLKDIFQITPNYCLDELVSGQLKVLDDNDRITLKGGERFFSHVRQGEAS